MGTLGSRFSDSFEPFEAFHGVRIYSQLLRFEYIPIRPNRLEKDTRHVTQTFVIDVSNVPCAALPEINEHKHGGISALGAQCVLPSQLFLAVKMWWLWWESFLAAVSQACAVSSSSWRGKYPARFKVEPYLVFVSWFVLG